MKKTLSFLSALVMMLSFVGFGTAAADESDPGAPASEDNPGVPATQNDIPEYLKLRPDDTGMCEWASVGWWVQVCEVYSPAMNSLMKVQVRPAMPGKDGSIYFLDGIAAQDGMNSWSEHGEVMQIFGDHTVALVLPLGGAAQFYTDWEKNPTRDGVEQSVHWESFLSGELPGYLQAKFGISPTNNAVAGISMGGLAAMNLAVHHREQFKHVSSISGYYQMTTPQSSVMLRTLMVPYGYNVDDMWGYVGSQGRKDHDPTHNIDQYQGMPVFISAATGLLYPSEMWGYLPSDLATRTMLEISSYESTQEFDSLARAHGLNITSSYTSTGIHSWSNWSQQVREARPQILAALGA